MCLMLLYVVIAFGWLIHSVAVDCSIDLGCDGMAHFLGDMSEQSGSTREQSYTAQQFRWQSYIRKSGSSYPRTIKRECSSKHSGMNATNGFEQAKVRASKALGIGDFDDDSGTRIS